MNPFTPLTWPQRIFVILCWPIAIPFYILGLIIGFIYFAIQAGFLSYSKFTD